LSFDSGFARGEGAREKSRYKGTRKTRGGRTIRGSSREIMFAQAAFARRKTVKEKEIGCAAPLG